MRASLHTPSAYYRCTGCQTAHLHPQPSAEFLDRFYEQYHRPAEEGGAFAEFEGRTSADFPKKASLVAKYLMHGASLCPADGFKVLDVGCGKGFFVQTLRQIGIPAEGIDISRLAVAEGTRSGIAGLHAGGTEERSDWTARFDAVTSWATIEHVGRPDQVMREFYRLLKPAGLLFLDTGLGGDFLEKWAPGLIQWYDPPQHLFVFSRAGMEKLLKNNGFALERLDANFERSCARRCAKLVRNRALAVAGFALFRLGLGGTVFVRMRQESKMPFGSLMFIVARKTQL